MPLPTHMNTYTFRMLFRRNCITSYIVIIIIIIANRCTLFGMAFDVIYVVYIRTYLFLLMLFHRSRFSFWRLIQINWLWYMNCLHKKIHFAAFDVKSFSESRSDCLGGTPRYGVLDRKLISTWTRTRYFLLANGNVVQQQPTHTNTRRVCVSLAEEPVCLNHNQRQWQSLKWFIFYICVKLTTQLATQSIQRLWDVRFTHNVVYECDWYTKMIELVVHLVSNCVWFPLDLCAIYLIQIFIRLLSILFVAYQNGIFIKMYCKMRLMR